MAETVVRYADIQPLYEEVRNLKDNLNQVKDDVEDMSKVVRTTELKLDKLSKAFYEYVKDAKRAEALAQATTELVRVRQEIEKKFGGYSQVRHAMLGVLQATDLALVKKTTISNISEELMISTPKYWLAPCLIAVAAWINNDRDLAERAIKEALRRDEERTALTMALICRRNERTNTCYEWLNIYFSKMNPGNFTAGGYTFVDAYINGVFGPDEKHMCSDYIERWIGQIKSGGSQFEESQKEQWKNFCVSRTSSHEEVYPTLKDHVDDFNPIKDYTDRIYSSNAIVREFHDIDVAQVNLEQMKKNVDDNLIEVINNYALEEITLRDEEFCFQKVKDSNGCTPYDEVKKALIARKKREQEEKFSLAEQMVNSILNKKNSSLSQKKTAISFLKPYINQGYDRYLEEKKQSFPQQISLKVDDFAMQADAQTNNDTLKQLYTNHMAELKAKEIEDYKKSAGKKNLIIAIACGVLGVISLALLPLAIIFFLVASFFGYKYYQVSCNPVAFLKQMDEKYNQILNNGYNTIDNCMNEWKTINAKAAECEQHHECIAA
ncbi:hypothetical protein [Fannyhessea vaginae]|uniref:hypothetical protein n=1 Tax=Fannyhessea vaginae TaxID=82135 RepID=UPI00076FC623|nr:hypothetical protein [Fannyhessea vaginae]KXG90616.1 hypothetical protein HMPREF3232_00544 [Fannyhessea vaginae]